MLICSHDRYDYSMSLAPEGREGLFTALASAPLFAAKLPTGAGRARCTRTQTHASCLALNPKP